MLVYLRAQNLVAAVVAVVVDTKGHNFAASSVEITRSCIEIYMSIKVFSSIRTPSVLKCIYMIGSPLFSIWKMASIKLKA